jgi:manganese transport protein
MLAIVTVGFLAGLIASAPDASQAVAGLVPRLSGVESAVLAVGMLGATVMPHAICLHSALIHDRHGRADPDCAAPMLRTIRLDVGLGLEPTRLLILSQVILSFGIPLALIPLVRIAADRDLMHLVPTRRATIRVAW